MTICEQCKEHHDGTYATGRFCSPRCSRKFASLAKRAEVNAKVSTTMTGKRRSLEETRECQKCGVNFRHKHSADKYCSTCKEYRIIAIMHDENDLIDYIRKGHTPTTKTIRNLLKKTRTLECVVCKGSEWLGNPMPLTLDHIDGNSENNHPSNLRWICPNCDRFTPTFGSRNRGKGRKSRRLQKRNEAHLFRKQQLSLI